ncbi:MAG: DUF559 domain-containing protein [Actinobacteria bacterium]|nr:DUF559 domain-containing protein [Actinomycetota bacterium]
MDDTDRPWIEARAAQLRRTMPDAETILWSFLRRRGVLGQRFRRQYVVGRVILDFYCPARRLAVEIDGPTHDLDEDTRRDVWLATQGIEVMRFCNDDIYTELYDVLGDITERLHVLAYRPRGRRIR